MHIRAWRYDMEGVTGHTIPIYMLDTDLDENDPRDRTLTDRLYGGDTNYRLAQEIVLGIGGFRMLDALGYDVSVYHKVVEISGRIPVLVRGGGKAADEEILQRTEALIQQGAAGIVYGRNVIQHAAGIRG